MLCYFQWEQNSLTISIWTYTFSILLLNQWEIIAKEFTSDVHSEDAAHIQNDLLYICLFTGFACWKTIYILLDTIDLTLL